MDKIKEQSTCAEALVEHHRKGFIAILSNLKHFGLDAEVTLVMEGISIRGMQLLQLPHPTAAQNDP